MEQLLITIPKNLWDDNFCVNYNESDLLLYRSKLLGSDLTITNYGGGNTSAKINQIDPLTGNNETMLWVKRSGCDLKTMKMDDFVVLYQSKIEVLKNTYQGLKHEAEMVGKLRYCFLKAEYKAPSIETFTHAFIPYKHVDHLHSDAIISIATSEHSEKLTQKIFKGNIGWIAWQRPGFDFALNLQKLIEKNPKIKGVVWQFHGLITWADDAKTCYNTSVNIISQAAEYINKQVKTDTFGIPKFPNATTLNRQKIAAGFMPRLRQMLSQQNLKIGSYFDDEDVLEFVNAENAFYFCNLGTSCPDHFLRTKIKPLFFRADVDQLKNQDTLLRLEKRIAEYVSDYSAYYNKHKDENSPALRDPYPAIILIPGLGMFAFGQSTREARISGEFYINAIHVMKGAESIGKYLALDEKEAFDIEYWSLEEDKLQRLPKEKGLARKTVLIVGIDNPEISNKMLSEDACVCISGAKTSNNNGDSTSESLMFPNSNKLSESVRECILQFGGIDIFVFNSSDVFLQKNKKHIISSQLLNTINFLVEQDMGGSVVIVHYAVEPNDSLDNFISESLKLLAHRFKKGNIRLNLVWVNPAESKKQQRISIANAIYFFASDLSLNCTGSIIHVN